MRYLTIEQRENLQRVLTSRAAALREEIAAALRSSGEPRALGLANHLEEIDDAAVADLESTLDIAALERDVRELRAVEAAAVRLHTPDFGLCDDCGTAIPYARLDVQPTATRCLACQTRRERAVSTATL
jgi:RNA polymerase-binding transcription factor DksA